MRLRAPVGPSSIISKASAWALWALVLAFGPGAATGQQAGPESTNDLPPDHRAWLDEVAVLITPAELQAFHSLGRGYQREAFRGRFWQERDPFPTTVRNEFRESWEHRLELARQRYASLEDDRARTMLLIGPPVVILTDLCPGLSGELEAWYYEVSEEFPDGFYLVFTAAAATSDSVSRRWSPDGGIEALVAAVDITSESKAPSQPLVLHRCQREGELDEVLEHAVDWQRLEVEEQLFPPRPKDWVADFLDRTTGIEANPGTLIGSLLLDFPGLHRERIVVQTLITIPRELATVGGETGGETAEGTYSIRLDGEVLRQENLLEQFRYQFDLPVSELEGNEIPLAFQRYLHPGDYTLILELEDLNSARILHTEQAIHVPVPDDSTASLEALAGVEAGEATRQFARQLAEANAVLTSGDHMVKILPLPDELLTGRVRVEAQVLGDGIAKVSFVLNGHRLMSKTRPPYSLEVDFGRAPRLHTLQAIAHDATGRELARDQVPINAGPHRFGVRLLEPQPGHRYVQSLRASAEVDLPASERLARVDFYLNETRLASLYQPPFVQPILLPQDERITYVRAVAYLDDGNATEDLVFINAPRDMEHLRINMVELYTTVSDRQGSPVAGLERDDFVVIEEGNQQRIKRFELVRDLSIHAGVVLDASTSMQEELDEAVSGALRFFDGVLQPKDRASVVVFNDEPLLVVPFTNNPELLSGGLVDVESTGETALYDTLVFTLHYFAGIRGKRALILLSDGEDSHSRYSFDEALEFARRSGVAIYTIGLGASPRQIEARGVLLRLARETGGHSYFIDSARQLDRIYSTIEEELRSQYLLAYQSTHQEGGKFRRVEVRVDRPGLKAKTIPGYYP